MLVYETVIEHVDRPWILVAALGLVGYPAVARLGKLLD